MCNICDREILTGVHTQHLSRRSLITMASVGALASLIPGKTIAKTKSKNAASIPSNVPKPTNILTPEQALERLFEGNQRYIKGYSKRHDFIVERESLVQGQNPYAGILSCADSRISPEYAFDSGRGDLFVARVAGNFANFNNIASFEYAVEVLKMPLLMVLGHDNCGAIKATISAVKDNTTYPGHITSLIDALSPAVKAASALNGDLLYNSTRENVKQNVEVLENSGPILSAAIKENKLKIIGAVYHLKTGEIELVS